MAESLENLKVRMDVEAAGFHEGMRRVAKSAEGIEDKFSKLAERARQVFEVGIVGALAAVGHKIAEVASEALDFADGMGKMAQQVGTTVESMSRLAYAAELSDVSAEELANSMRHLAKAAAGAASGNAEQADLFKRLGVEVRDANGQVRPAIDLFHELAQRFSELQEGPERTAAALELFGKTGDKLFPLFKEGAAGLRELGAEADRFGATISGDVASKAEALNDSFTRMKAVYRGLVAEFVAGDSKLAAVAAGLERVYSALPNDEKFTRDRRGGLGAGAGPARRLGPSERQMAEELERAEDARADKLSKHAEAARKAAEAQKKLREEIEKQYEPGRKLWDELMQRAKSTTDEVATEDERHAEAVANLTRLLDQRVITTETYERAMAKLNEGLERTAELEREVVAAARERERDEDALAADIEGKMAQGFERSVEAQRKRMEEMKQIAEAAASGMAGIFTDHLFDGFKRGLDGMLRDWVDFLARMAVTMASQRLIGAGLGYLFGGLGGAAAGASSTTYYDPSAVLGISAPSHAFSPTDSGAGGAARTAAGPQRVVHEHTIAPGMARMTLDQWLERRIADELATR